MAIKAKPMKFQENLEKFRSHDPESEIVNTSGMDARITKTVRMRHRFSLMLKEEAHHRSIKRGSRVSEADLLDEALEDFRYKLQGNKENRDGT